MSLARLKDSIAIALAVLELHLFEGAEAVRVQGAAAGLFLESGRDVHDDGADGA